MAEWEDSLSITLMAELRARIRGDGLVILWMILGRCCIREAKESYSTFLFESVVVV